MKIEQPTTFSSSGPDRAKIEHLSARALDLRIAYIGGGSRNWARLLMRDLALCPQLEGEMRLYDIDLEAAHLNETLGNWLQGQPGVISHWRYRAVERLEQALQGADFAFISIQPGLLEMMAHEIAVAEKYGLYFPVGDTTGAPGLMRGLRSAIIFSGFAEAIAEHCPQAWVINYTNPMSICTRTLTRVAPELKVFGCCHEVFGTQRLLAELAQDALHLPATPPRQAIRVNVLGINHFTWIDQADYQGHDLLALLQEHIQKPGVMRPYTRQEVERAGNWFHDANQIKYALFQRYGILPAAGDRHLSEFLPGFTRSPEELFRWGLIRTPVSWRMQTWKDSLAYAQGLMSGRIPLKLKSSNEEAVRQLVALAGLGDPAIAGRPELFVTNINAANAGQMAGFPRGVVVETNAMIQSNLVQPLAAGDLPPGVHSLVARHIANQEMMIEAALARDADLAFQAVYNDPTTHLPVDQAYQMFQEIGLPAGLW
jgi:alpha-galactosidase